MPENRTLAEQTLVERHVRALHGLHKTLWALQGLHIQEKQPHRMALPPVLCASSEKPHMPNVPQEQHKPLGVLHAWEVQRTPCALQDPYGPQHKMEHQHVSALTCTPQGMHVLEQLRRLVLQHN